MINQVSREQTSQRYKSIQLRGTIIMLTATLSLSGSSVLAKFVYRENVEPMTMLALRFGTAAGLLWLLYLLSGRWRPYIGLKSRGQFWSCVIVGLTNSVSQSLFFIALTDLNPGLAQMIFSFNPAIIALIMFFLGEPLTRLKTGRIGLALGGLYFLTLAGGSSGKPINTFSVVLIIICSIVYALHFVLYQKLLGTTSSRTNTLYILSTMAFGYVGIELARHGITVILTVSGTAWLYILVMAVICTCIARLLMFEGLALIGGTQAALIGVAEPVLVVFASVILLSEQLSLNQWFGASLVVGSVALTGLIKKSAPAPLSETVQLPSSPEALE